MVALLAGCSGATTAGGGDPGICIKAPKVEESIKDSGDYSGTKNKLNGCVMRWAYRLANAPGSTGEIADAVMGGCEDGIELAAEEYAKLAYPDAKLAEVRDSAVAEERRQALSKAKFYVAVGRAGHCKAP